MNDLQLLNFFSYGLGLGMLSWLLALGFRFVTNALFGYERIDKDYDEKKD